MRGGLNPPLIKIVVSENAFQAIKKPISPYSITSILSKVVHSSTLSLTISFAFSGRPLGALERFPCGGGGHIICNASLSQPNVQKKQQSPCEGGGGGGGLKFEKKKCLKNSAYVPLYFVLFHLPPTQ